MHKVVRMLKALSLRYVSGVSGGYNPAFMDALLDTPEMTIVAALADGWRQ